MSEESKSWYRMTRPLFNSGFEDDEFWAYGQDGFQEVLDSFIGSDVLIYDKATYVEPQQVRAIVQNKTSDVYNSTTVRQILCNIGILKCGQYVKYDGAFWLVSALPDNNRIYEKAVLWKCRHIIRFLSPLTGELVEYPIFSTNSTQYGTGEEERPNITVGDDQHLVYLPYNEETILLDDRFRFIMDKNRKNPTVYRITRVDPITYAVGGEREEDGLIQWAVLETQFNEATDSRDEMVANYFSTNGGESGSVSGESGTLVLTDLDGDLTLAVGERKQIRVSCVLSDGSSPDSFDYRLEYDFAGGAAEVVSVENDVVTLQATGGQDYIGFTVLVRAISDTLNSEASLKILIVNW